MRTARAPTRGRLRVGVIGLGGMGRGHCSRMATDVPEMRLAAVCDSDAATADEGGAAFGVPAFRSHRDLIRSGLADAVIVATPHPLHPPIAIAAMKAGLHVLTEKPLSENIYTAEKMVRAARRAGVVLGVMFQQRFDPAHRAALEVVRSGALGRIIRAVLIAPDYRSQAYYDAGAWRATWAGEGGGVLINQAPHAMDFFVALAGMPETVTGTVAAKLHRIEVEDFAQAVLAYKGGGVGYVYCTTNEPGPAFTLEVAGDRGKLLYRGGELRLLRFPVPVGEFTRRNKDMWAKPACEDVPLKFVGRPTGHADVMRNFARHILRGEPLLCSGQSGLGQLELANAIVLSSHLGRTLTLPINRRAYDRFLAGMRRKFPARKKVARTQRITDPAFRK
jgi:predicted dehydrogenase